MRCVICDTLLDDIPHWTGDMFRWSKKNKRNRADGVRFICLCDDCFQKHINSNYKTKKEADN